MYQSLILKFQIVHIGYRAQAYKIKNINTTTQLGNIEIFSLQARFHARFRGLFIHLINPGT